MGIAGSQHGSVLCHGPLLLSETSFGTLIQKMLSGTSGIFTQGPLQACCFRAAPIRLVRVNVAASFCVGTCINVKFPGLFKVPHLFGGALFNVKACQKQCFWNSGFSNLEFGCFRKGLA